MMSSRLRKFFISFEGGEGSGKGTVIAHIKTLLKKQGFPVLVSREPGGTPYAEHIREVIFDKKGVARKEGGVHERAETLLFCAARAQHIERLVRPALESGKIVLMDRFEDSTFVYQGAGRASSAKERNFMRLMSAYARGEIYPSLTVFLDINPKIGLARKIRDSKRGKEVNRFDREKLHFHKTIRHAYRMLAKQDVKRWRIIKADAPVEKVVEDVWAVIQDHLKIPQ